MIKEQLKERLLAAGIGFLIGDIIIGSIVWFIVTLFNFKWDSSVPYRMIAGTIFAVIGFIIGEQFLYPLFSLVEKIEKNRKRKKK
ncbi:hypothetical protein ACFL6W_03475 [Thermodesulfobacteriota bacterium]